MAKKKQYTVRVSYKVYEYYDVDATSEEKAIEKALEKAGDDSLNDFMQEGDGEGVVTIINGKPTEPKRDDEPEKVWVLFDESLCDYELQEANVIYASNLGIQSLQGIAFFYNLTHLDVSGNPLGGTLDLTTNTLLQNVNVSNCELNGLVLTGLTHLNTLLLSDNDTGWAAPDLSTNLALEILDCHNCDGMEGLDLSANVNLIDLDCSWNQL